MIGKVLALLAFPAGYLAYKTIPELQSLKLLSPSGDPLQILVPVQSLGNLGRLLIGQVPNKNVNAGAPVVLTMGGPSNFKVLTNQDVQRALNTLGYSSPPLTIDGKIGPMTQGTIKLFQSAKGLTADGQVTPALKGALTAALILMTMGNQPIGQSDPVLNAKSPPPNLTTIKDVQHALNVLGASPALVEDGSAGPKTTAAVKAFQIGHGLIPDGVPGPKTKTALALALQQWETSHQQIAGDFGNDLTIQHGNLSITHSNTGSFGFENSKKKEKR